MQSASGCPRPCQETKGQCKHERQRGDALVSPRAKEKIDVCIVRERDEHSLVERTRAGPRLWMTLSLCGGKRSACVRVSSRSFGFSSHPVHPFPSSAPLHFIPFLLFSLSLSQPYSSPPHFHSFPFTSPENTLPAFPHHNHGSTMARSQSLLTPEPTHIVRQPVTICHVCVSSLRPPLLDGKMARSLMPCNAMLNRRCGPLLDVFILFL